MNKNTLRVSLIKQSYTRGFKACLFFIVLPLVLAIVGAMQWFVSVNT